jgi:5-(carboxyamino)imidazole ribonucleotide synthase
MSTRAAALPSMCKSPAWLGILGGGQLGRMFIHEAQSLGFKVCVLDPDPLSPAGSVAEKHLCADYLDEVALAEMAALCSAISTEFENIPAQALDFFKDRGIFVAPDSSCVSIAQDRIKEKAFLARCASLSGVGPVPYGVISSAADLSALPDHLFPGILKTVRLGYDGKGQITVQSREQLAAAWHDLGQVDCVLEKRMALAFEVSAIVARGHDGAIRSFPPSENVHRQGILHTSTVPSPSLQQHPALLERIQKASSAIAQEMNYVGVLCVEFFVLTDGSVVANEIAPRPHNSGHYTMDACVTSQFQQQVRAMACLPLGDTRLLSPVAMLNILGDAWFTNAGRSNTAAIEPAWERVLTQGDAKLHLYGKASPLPGRKMGHVNCLGKSLDEAQQTCRAVANDLGIAP